MFEKDLCDPIGGGIVTYAVDGKQYVAVAAGMDNPRCKPRAVQDSSFRAVVAALRKQRIGDVLGFGLDGMD